MPWINEHNAKVGDFITVNKWKNSNDTFYTDDVLEVLAVSGNLIRVKRRGYPKGSLGAIETTLHVEQAEILQLDQDFVKAVIDRELELEKRYEST